MFLNIKLAFGVHCVNDKKRALADYDKDKYDISNCGNKKIFEDNTYKDADPITHLHAKNNSIRKLNSAELMAIKNVVYIDLTNNEIEEIKEDTFSENANLEVLILTDNPIKKIQIRAFRDLDQLKTLNLANNELKTLEPGLFNESSLEEIDLSLNMIKQISFNAFFNMKSLEVLKLENNPCANQTIEFNDDNERDGINKILFEKTICFKEKYCNAVVDYPITKKPRILSKGGATTIANSVSTILIIMIAYLISV